MQDVYNMLNGFALDIMDICQIVCLMDSNLNNFNARLKMVSTVYKVAFIVHNAHWTQQITIIVIVHNGLAFDNRYDSGLDFDMDFLYPFCLHNQLFSVAK